MSENPKLPAPPKGTGPSGKALWRSVVAAWELEEHETRLLVEAVRLTDVLDRLHEVVVAEGEIIKDRFGAARTNPALVEERQCAVTLAKLLAALRLPDGVAGDESAGRRRQRQTGVRGVHGFADMAKAGNHQRSAS